MANSDTITEKPFFTLEFIADWQLGYKNSPVGLPPLQRGFVWKIDQIESLWDSLLRGFPIGSFLLSTTSVDEKFDLLDGQQRATSIAIGLYDPWHKKENEESEFWSLKKIPIVWIDLIPTSPMLGYKFVIRVVTQSHPWGYNRNNNKLPLRVQDKKKALEIFRKIPGNEEVIYIDFLQENVFPFDAYLPVPLSFIIKAITENEVDWKADLILMCKDYLPINNIKTKYTEDKDYLELLTETLNNPGFDENIFNAIKNLPNIKIPGIIVKKEILKAEDENSGQDAQNPTLFVRLNNAGTTIGVEELIYSIYKASFPKAKDLVERIGVNFIAPSLVISLVSRLAIAEIDKRYQQPINVNDFRKKIQEVNFKDKLEELIGSAGQSPVERIFKTALNALRLEKDIEMPPILVKSIIKSSPELFLMLLQWIKMNGDEVDSDTRRKISGTITALSWFGVDNPKYVGEIWDNIHKKDFWNKQVLGIPFINKKTFCMYPLINPSMLRDYLLRKVVEEKMVWKDLLNPDIDSEIAKVYLEVLSSELKGEDELKNAVNFVWRNFLNKLFHNRSLVLFAQRSYIKQSFGEFNQMEDLKDTNTPWDWDHIYPKSWIVYQHGIHPNTKLWNDSIGNYRAISLEQNRSDGNREFPKAKLEGVGRENFFIDKDWEYWSQINRKITDGDNPLIEIHLRAIVNRLCNIYEEWYSELNIGQLFNYQNEID